LKSLLGDNLDFTVADLLLAQKVSGGPSEQRGKNARDMWTSGPFLGAAARSVFSFALIPALLSCTMIPKYERAPIPVAPRFPGTAESQAEPALTETDWQNFFADERLKTLIEIALVNNRDLRVAVLNVEESRAQYRITRSASFPTFNATAAYTRSEASLAGFPQASSGSGGPSTFTSGEWNANLGATAYEVDLWGRVRSLNHQALEKYFATEEARRNEQISLMSTIAIEYFTLREAEEALQVSTDTLQAVQQSYAVNKAMFEAGAGSELDLRTAEGQVETAKINVLTHRREKAQAEDYIVLLIGEPIPANLPAPRLFTDPHLLPEVRAGLPSELLQRRPDILEAEHSLKAANANIGAARAAFFPTITLTGSIGTTSSELSKLFSSGTQVWSFAPQISLPIFNGGQNRANLDAAKINERIEVANYEKAIQVAFREVADALVGVSNYSRQMDQEADLVNTEKRRYELAGIRYHYGADTYLSVLSAQQDLYNAQQALIQAQFNKLSSQISLYQALGGVWN
jgi:outer membrane protein, multidrug efflux system